MTAVNSNHGFDYLCLIDVPVIIDVKVTRGFTPVSKAGKAVYRFFITTAVV